MYKNSICLVGRKGKGNVLTRPSASSKSLFLEKGREKEEGIKLSASGIAQRGHVLDILQGKTKEKNNYWLSASER